MGPEKLLLVAAEWPDQVGAFDPPTAQRLAGGLVFTDQLTAGSKADPVPVEQLVHMGLPEKWKIASAAVDLSC